MKKYILLILILIVFSSQDILAGFYAQRVDGYGSWSIPKILKFESKLEVYGLLYETSINLKLKLGKERWWDYYSSYTCVDPPQGKYEFIWTFTLPKNAYIKELLVWDKNNQNFVSAGVIDLSTGELQYNPASTVTTNVLLRQYMRRDYNGNYDLQYDLRISPINWDEDVEFIIKYISPCEMSYNKRIVQDFSNQFYTTNYYQDCNTNSPATFLAIDNNNPESQPENFISFEKQWAREGGYWKSSITVNEYYSNFKLAFPVEAKSGKFLQTYSDGNYKFYQLATKPHISDQIRNPRKIILAFDLIQEYFNEYSRNNFIEMIKEALLISTTEKDSIVFVSSDFNVIWLNETFEPRTEALLNENLNSVKGIIPKLNTLPYMLKDIVQFLNDKNTDAEIWLLSDDYRTGVRAETVMELLEQTYFQSKNKIKFNILDVSGSYNGYYIQNKYYRGNEYLYENLTRLSGGNFNNIYNKYYKYIIDDVLDCFAPKISTVEIDPIPSNGFTHSRINLNNGRNNFNITSRYFQLGMLEGDSQINVNYYGNYLGNNYFNSIQLNEDITNTPEYINENTALYWYGDYILNNLFLQPQSYSTIKYIEELSVNKHLLTPYSAFIIPGPSGYSGYVRIYEDEVTSVEQKEENEIGDEVLPSEINLSSYPNPFNPSTTIVMKLPVDLLKENKQLEIYDILGQKIKSFDLSGFVNSTEIKVDWNGLNDFGNAVSSGTYLAVLKTSKVIKTLKLLLVR